MTPSPTTAAPTATLTQMSSTRGASERSPPRAAARVHPEPQPVVAIATGVAVTTMNEEVTVLGLLAGQPSTRQVQVRRSSLQPPGFELQTYWPVREGLNAPRHGTPQVVHTCASLTSHLDLATLAGKMHRTMSPASLYKDGLGRSPPAHSL